MEAVEGEDTVVEEEEDTAAKVQGAIQARLGTKGENHRRDQAPHTPTQAVVPPLDPAPRASLTDTIMVGHLFLIAPGSCRH